MKNKGGREHSKEVEEEEEEEEDDDDDEVKGEGGSSTLCRIRESFESRNGSRLAPVAIPRKHAFST